MRRILLFVGLLVAIGGGVAWAAIPDSGGVIHACVVKATKTIRLIDTSRPSELIGRCTSLETELTWSQRGPAGPAGTAGPKGDKGDAGPAGPAGGQTPPDPLEGDWALLLDGMFAAPVRAVEGCGVGSSVVRETIGPDGIEHKHLGAPSTGPCRISLGLSMEQPLVGWIAGVTGGSAFVRHQVTLVRTDAAGAQALRLLDTSVAAVTVPALDRSGTNPGFVELDLRPDAIIRIASPGLPAGTDLALHPIDASTLDVRLDGAALAPARTGPLRIEVVIDDTGEVRLPVVYTHVGDLGLRVPEAESASIGTLDAFMTSFIVQGNAGQGDEKPLSLTVSDGGTRRLRVAVGQSGIAQGDFAPRTDGARRYTLYGETATITQP